MKVLKPLALLTVLLAFTACDDDWIMDLEPPFGGYIWRMAYSYIYKIDPVTGEAAGEGYETPFYDGYDYDAAAGDGRVWVGGAKYDYGIDDYKHYIWEVNGEEFDVWSNDGLTYDGEHLWYNFTASYQDGDYIIVFYRVDPDSHENERMFEIDIPDPDSWSRRLRFRGLAWDGECFWAITTPKSAFVRIDPANGDIIRTIPCQIDGPRGLTWDGEALWVNDAKNDWLYRVSPDDGSILGYHQMSPAGRLPPPAPYGLAFEFPSE